jgi:putative Mg2+ transporter-C (MgtC) family protein
VSPFEKTLLVKILYSIFCGFVVGIERQWHKKPIDVRTSILVCLGTMAFIYLGEEAVGGEKDATRVLGQVVTGIGFLGAGVIMTRQGAIQGMTSASVVWMLASIGAAIGFGRYSMAITLSLVAFFVLAILQFVEDWTAKLLLLKIDRKTSRTDKT